MGEVENWYSLYSDLSVDELKEMRTIFVNQMKKIHTEHQLTKPYRDKMIQVIQDKIDGVNFFILLQQENDKKEPYRLLGDVKIFEGENAFVHPEEMWLSESKTDRAFLYFKPIKEMIICRTGSTHLGCLWSLSGEEYNDESGNAEISEEMRNYLNKNYSEDWGRAMEEFVNGRVSKHVMSIWTDNEPGQNLNDNDLSEILKYFPNVKEVHRAG